jgi:hypothetical protein
MHALSSLAMAGLSVFDWSSTFLSPVRPGVNRRLDFVNLPTGFFSQHTILTLGEYRFLMSLFANVRLHRTPRMQSFDLPALTAGDTLLVHGLLLDPGDQPANGLAAYECISLTSANTYDLNMFLYRYGSQFMGCVMI